MKSVWKNDMRCTGQKKRYRIKSEKCRRFERNKIIEKKRVGIKGRGEEKRGNCMTRALKRGKI